MAKLDYAVFIGRFQPFHLTHNHIVRIAAAEANEVIIVVGSYRTSKSIKNPWSFEFRKNLIEKSLSGSILKRTHIVHARDYLYSDDKWVLGVQQAVRSITGEGKTISLYGTFKDDTSYYLKMFPQWGLRTFPLMKGLSADGTQIRTWMYERNNTWEGHVASGIVRDLQLFKRTPEFKSFVDSYQDIQHYRALWSNVPFPPTFVTTDAVVVKAGHVLIIKRKINPGKGMLALPGGFVHANERIIDSCRRELHEETNFPGAYRLQPVESQVFDHPLRSSRGRTITHAFLFRLPPKAGLPEVKGGDDAAEAFWMPLSDITLQEENFFEDHIHIINHFTVR